MVQNAGFLLKTRQTQGKMVQNVVQNGAKRSAKSINIHCNCINKTFKNHEKLGQKGQNGR